MIEHVAPCGTAGAGLGLHRERGFPPLGGSLTHFAPAQLGPRPYGQIPSAAMEALRIRRNIILATNWLWPAGSFGPRTRHKVCCRQVERIDLGRRLAILGLSGLARSAPSGPCDKMHV